MDPSAHLAATGAAQRRDFVQLGLRNDLADAVEGATLPRTGDSHSTLPPPQSLPQTALSSSKSSHPMVQLVPQLESEMPAYSVVQLNLTDVDGRALEGSGQLLQPLHPHHQSDTRPRDHHQDVTLMATNVSNDLPQSSTQQRRDVEYGFPPERGSIGDEAGEKSSSQIPAFRFELSHDQNVDSLAKNGSAPSIDIIPESSTSSTQQYPPPLDSHDVWRNADAVTALAVSQYAVTTPDLPADPTASSAERDLSAPHNDSKGARLGRVGEIRQPAETGKSNERSLECEDCGKAFQMEQHLAQHRKTHELKEKPYSCDDCGRAFVSSASLRQHIKVCPVVREKLVKQKPKPIVCQVCDQKFVSKASLERHAVVHKGKP